MTEEAKNDLAKALANRKVEEMNEKLADLQSMFTAGTRITFLARNEFLPESSVFITDDEPAKILSSIMSFTKED